MSNSGLLLVGVAALCVALIIVVFVWTSNRKASRGHKTASRVETPPQDLDGVQKQLAAEGREQLERVVEENAAFIQQDVRRTTSELNGFMQQEITRTLDEELKQYRESTNQINRIAAESISRVQTLLDERYIQLSAQVDSDVNKEKERIIAQFEKNMSDVVGYYVKSALSSNLDVSTQLDYIIGQLEENKAAIIEDLRHG